MTATTTTTFSIVAATLDPRALPRLAWSAAYRAARSGRDGTPHGPEVAAADAAWIVTGLRDETRVASKLLGIAAAYCRPYRCRSTVGAALMRAMRDHHGIARTRELVRILARGNTRDAARLPGATPAVVTLAEAA